MARAFILVLDSLGIGWAPDADRYGDAGADTLGHIAEACARGEADREGARSGPLNLPCLASLALAWPPSSSPGGPAPCALAHSARAFRCGP